MAIVELTPVAAEEEEAPQLHALASHLTTDAKPGGVTITDSEGHELDVPGSVLQLLSPMVRALADGSAIVVLPIDAELTTQQAADILQVSRPHLVKLLNAKQLPYTSVGRHRRIKVADLLEYQRVRAEARRKTLRQMTAEAEKDGLPY